MIIADSPSWRATRCGRVRDLFHGLPFPPSSFREITNQLFVAPEKLPGECLQAFANRFQHQMLGLSKPTDHGSFTEVAGKPSFLTAAVELDGCLVRNALDGTDFDRLPDPVLHPNTHAG